MVGESFNSDVAQVKPGAFGSLENVKPGLHPGYKA
jgi:hypothetical protein